MRKIRFTEHQIIAVLKSVEAGMKWNTKSGHLIRGDIIAS